MTETEPKTKFESPYKGQDLAPSHIQVDIGTADNNLIRAIRPRQGTLQITAQHLWNKLCNELRKRNITGFDSVDEFEQFLTTSVLVDAADYQQLVADSTEFRRTGLHDRSTGGVIGGPRKNSSRQNVRRGVKNIRPGTSSESTELPIVQSGSGTSSGEKPEQGEVGQKGS